MRRPTECSAIACSGRSRYCRSMKFVSDRDFANPDAAARKLVELANAFEPVHDGRIYIEKINGPFLYQLKGTPAEYKAGLDCAIAKGWLVLHESGTYVEIHRGRRHLVCLTTSCGTDARIGSDSAGAT